MIPKQCNLRASEVEIALIENRGDAVGDYLRQGENGGIGSVRCKLLP
jgi:hypothetical protein